MSLIGPGASDVITARDADKQCKLPPRLAEMSEIQEGIKASQAVLKDARKFFADKAAAAREAKAAQPKATAVKAGAKKKAKK